MTRREAIKHLLECSDEYDAARESCLRWIRFCASGGYHKNVWSHPSDYERLDRYRRAREMLIDAYHSVDQRLDLTAVIDLIHSVDPEAELAPEVDRLFALMWDGAKRITV